MALNFNLDSLLETSLLSDDPWWIYILKGAGWTVGLAVSAFALALFLGIIVGSLRTTERRWVRVVCEGWIELFDPVASQFLSAFLCIGLFTSSRVAEQVRAGITSLPKGLKNAGLALGFTRLQTYTHIIIPLALRIIVPPLTSEAMNLVKNTAVAITIGLPEITMRANEMGENTFQFFAAYLWATVIYVVIALGVNRSLNFVEARCRIPGFIAAK